MIIITGGAGFIGSNLARTLNQQGRRDIIIVDNLQEGRKFSNLAGVDIADYIDQDDFLTMLLQDRAPLGIEVIFHQGACSATTEWNGRYMMKNNYDYSKSVLHFCSNHRIPLIYASSAAVYGGSDRFVESPVYEKPLNVYGYSKWQFDQYVRRLLPSLQSKVVGLRYFNVYGPYEDHKGPMASVAYHLHQQLKKGDNIQLFSGCDGYADGEQSRDFIYVDDVVAVNLWFFNQAPESGIFNVGTGKSQSFNEVAHAVIAWHGRGKLEYIPFPAHLRGCYQSFTQADITALRKAGYNARFKTVQEGVCAYLNCLEQKL